MQPLKNLKHGKITKHSPWVNSKKNESLTLRKVLQFINDLNKNKSIEKGDILFVGSSKYKTLVQLAAFKSNQSFVNATWKPGTLSNWVETQKQVDKFHKEKSKLVYQLSDIIKNKSQSRYKISYKRCESFFKSKNRWGGLELNVVEPRIVVILDPENNLTVLRECQKRLIPTIGFVNNGSSIKGITYPILQDQRNLFSLMSVLNILTQYVNKLNN